MLLDVLRAPSKSVLTWRREFDKTVISVFFINGNEIDGLFSLNGIDVDEDEDGK